MSPARELKKHTMKMGRSIVLIQYLALIPTKPLANHTRPQAQKVFVRIIAHPIEYTPKSNTIKSQASGNVNKIEPPRNAWNFAIFPLAFTSIICPDDVRSIIMSNKIHTANPEANFGGVFSHIVNTSFISIISGIANTRTQKVPNLQALYANLRARPTSPSP